MRGVNGLHGLPETIRFIFTVVALSAMLATASKAGSVNYEAPPVFPANELLSRDLLQSQHHQIQGDVTTVGNLYQFDVESDVGYYQITSLAMLRIRVHEISVVSQAMSRFDAANRQLSDELRSELGVSADSAVDIVTSPVSTALDLANQVTTNLGDTFAGADGIVIEEQTYRVTSTEDIVYAAHKRNIAYQLDLDVYSSNPSVQKFLDVIATARTAGNFTAGVSTITVPRGDEVMVAKGMLDAEVKATIKHLTPVELDAYNDQKLAAMEVSPGLRRKFLQHPVYSPTRKTYIVAYLETLDGVANRSAVIEAARGAKTEEGALYYEQMARMLAFYHERARTIRELRYRPQLPVAITENGQALYVIPVDIVYWNEGSASLFDGLARRAGMAGYTGQELITTGTLTNTARGELTGKGFTIQEEFLTVH